MNQENSDIIRKQKDRLRLLKSEAEVIKQHLIRDCPEFFKSWYETKAREYVVKESEKTRALSKESIKEMKDKVVSLCESAQEVAEKIFNTAAFTVPFEEGSFEKKQEPHVRGEEYLRLALGRLGPILQDYGYLTDMDQWFKVDTSTGGILARYPYKMDLPLEIENLVSEYDAIALEAGQLSRQIKESSSSKDSSKEAENLWDSI